MRNLMLAFLMCALVLPAANGVARAQDVFPADPIPGHSGEKRVVGEFMELRDNPDHGIRGLHTGMDIQAPSGAEVYPPLPAGDAAFHFSTESDLRIIVAAHSEGTQRVYFKAGHIVQDPIPLYGVYRRDIRLGVLRSGSGAHLHAEIWWSPFYPPVGNEENAISPRYWAFGDAEWMPDYEKPIIEDALCEYDGDTYTWYVYAHDPVAGTDDMKKGICSIDIYANNMKVAGFDFTDQFIRGASAEDFYRCLGGCSFVYKLQWMTFGDVPPEWRIEVCDCSRNCEYKGGDFPTVQEGVHLTAMVESDELQLKWIAPDAQYWFVEFEVLESIDDSQVLVPINESPIPVVTGQYEYSYTHRLPRDWERLEYRIHGIDEHGEAVLVAKHELQNEMLAVNKLSVSPVPASGPVQISLQLAGSDHARVHVYDASGRLVRSICDERLSAGKTDLQWDGKDSSGRKVPSGIYFAKAQLKSANHEELRRVIILR